MAINIVYGDPLLMHVKISSFCRKKARTTCRVGGLFALQQCQRGRMRSTSVRRPRGYRRPVSGRPPQAAGRTTVDTS
jgi:hypothetical protein